MQGVLRKSRTQRKLLVTTSLLSSILDTAPLALITIKIKKFKLTRFSKIFRTLNLQTHSMSTFSKIGEIPLTDNNGSFLV